MLFRSAMVFPVGVGFDLVSKLHPGIELYQPDVVGFKHGPEGLQPVYAEDVKHPSSAGSYLAACVIYAVLTGHSPQGLAFSADLDPAIVEILQRSARDAVDNYYTE